jgi:hypothetical protein
VKETMLPNSPAIPLPIPLPATPIKPRQLVDIHEINDIDSALFGCRRRFSLLSGKMRSSRRFGQRAIRMEPERARLSRKSRVYRDHG